MPSIAGMLQLHRPDARLDRLRAELDCSGWKAAAASFTRNAIAQAEGPCSRAKLLAEAVRLGIDDEVDVALPVQRDVLAAMPRA